MNYKAIVFDLDGTLIDSELDLMYSSNYAMEQFGYPTHSEEAIKSFIGNGAMKLLERCLPESVRSSLATSDPQIDMDELYKLFMNHYLLHCHEHTYTHPGVREFLDQHKDLPMAILTNKPIEPTLQIVKHLKIDHYFKEIVGGDSFPTRKPETEGLSFLLKQLNTTAQETLMVGDGVPDVQVAHNLGLDVVAILEGIGNSQSLKAENPTFEIPRFEDISKLSLKLGK